MCTAVHICPFQSVGDHCREEYQYCNALGQDVSVAGFPPLCFMHSAGKLYPLLPTTDYVESLSLSHPLPKSWLNIFVALPRKTLPPIPL